MVTDGKWLNIIYNAKPQFYHVSYTHLNRLSNCFVYACWHDYVLDLWDVIWEESNVTEMSQATQAVAGTYVAA